MNNLNDLIELQEGFDAQKFDVTVPPDALMLNDNGHIAFPRDLIGQMAPLPMTDWAAGQLCSKLKIPAGYFRRCPGHLQADNVNHWTRNRDGNGWLIRGYNKEHGFARAVLSDQYVPLNSSEILRMIQELVEDDGGLNHKVKTRWCDPDGMRIQFETRVHQVDEGDRHSLWSTGFTVRNGDIGNSMVEIAGFTKRGPCDNTMEFSEDMLQQKHIHIGMSELKFQIRIAIGKALEKGDHFVEMAAEAALEEMPSLASILRGYANDNNLDQEMENQLFTGTEGKHTRLGVANALSYAAQFTEDQDLQLKMERDAGDVLAHNLFAGARQRQHARVR